MAAVIAAVLVLGSLAVWVGRRRRVAAVLGDRDLVVRLLGTDLDRVPLARIACVALAAAMLAGAAVLVPGGGDDAAPRASAVVLVLDASTSMLARDVEPHRLALVREAARTIARAAEGTPVGIVAFAGRAYALAPPTADPGAVELYVDALDPSGVPQTGSSLVAAVRQGLGLLAAMPEPGAGAIVLISDGDVVDDPGDLLEASDIARRAGITIHTLGVGTAEGGRVPRLAAPGARPDGYLTTADGAPVVSRLLEGPLRSLAGRTGGVYERLGAGAGPARVVAALGAGGFGGATEPPRPGLAGWLVGAALALLLLDGAAAWRRGLTVGLLIVLGACDRPDPAERFAAGDYAGAAAGYAARLSAHPADLVAHYDLGATLLRMREFDAARPHLEAAAREGTGAARRWGAYNAGNTDLEPVFADRSTPNGADRLRRAIQAYRYALRIDPSDADAKWNLELALRLLRDQPENPPPSGGGGAGGGGGGGGGAGGGLGRPNPQPLPGGAGGEPALDRAEAERVLDRAEMEEAGRQREALARPQPSRISH